MKEEGTTYALFADGSLWTLGEYGYCVSCGCDPEWMADQIFDHREEMRVMCLQDLAEFGY